MTGEPVIPREANRILVYDFRGAPGDRTLRTRLGIRVRELLAADGRLAVVADEDQADLALEGVVTGHETRPLRYSEMGRAVSKRMRITASVRLFDRNKNREIFFEREIQAFEEFSDIEPPVVPEAAALDRVIDALAKRIAQQTMRGSYAGLLTPVEKGRQ
ncbi:MAG TPA: LPS assembly lipoprotein LptE [Spirochaetota bacterium]|nr:LPS assembly lipoprotein LptE [Spirochaetota bacterium]